MNQIEFAKRYNRLNPKQKQAVDTVEGPVMVVAGPGTGKTELLSMRVANILNTTDTLPSQILCLTFTDAAAKNMRERLQAIIGTDAYKVAIHTFHSLANDIINKNPEFFFTGISLKPADELIQKQILNGVFDGLEVGNPVRIFAEGYEYTYLSDVAQIISSLKREGISPEEYVRILKKNESFLSAINPICKEVFAKPARSLTAADIEEIIEKVHNWVIENPMQGNASDIFGANHLVGLFIQDCKFTLEELYSLEKASTKPITKFKNTWFKKNAHNEFEFKDLLSLPKNYATADIYASYQTEMRNAGYFDFDDMLLEVNTAIDTHNELKYNLQEQFQYFLIDEFQDTNGAQAGLVRRLAQSKQAEGRPNIMAVGDEDQAIFRFQGAEVKNIEDFLTQYRDPEIILLDTNYRSHQYILSSSKEVIESGERLDIGLPQKTLQPHSISENATLPSVVQCTTREHEIGYVLSAVQELIMKGVQPSEIALISKKHALFQEYVKVFQGAKIPFQYEYGQNVIEQPVVQACLAILQFAASLGGQPRYDLLKDILFQPWWGLSVETIASISVLSGYSKERRTWMEVMWENYSAHGHPDLNVEYASFTEPGDKLQWIINYLMRLHTVLTMETAEQVFDRILGSDGLSVTYDEYDDENKTDSINQPFFSPLLQWISQQTDSMVILSSIKTLYAKLRGYGEGEPSVIEALTYIELLEKNNISIIDTSAYTRIGEGVQFLSAHKSKGLEFEYVFVLDCIQSVWNGKGKSLKISLPKNLPIDSSKQDQGDKLRLLYVAMTRAKKHLTFCTYDYDAQGKQTELIEFLQGISDVETITPEFKTQENLSLWMNAQPQPEVLSTSISEIVSPLLQKYTLSVTHLNTFLNLEDGGPQAFLEYSLLRFPRAKSRSAAFGTAIHETIRRWYLAQKKGKVLTKNEVQLVFKDLLGNERMNEFDYTISLDEGFETLSSYYDMCGKNITPEADVEINFSAEQVVIGEVKAHITGAIDRMESISDHEVKVIDLKTGKPSTSWKGSGYDKTKLWKYKNQLIFYKLLVENSRSYSNKEVVVGALEFVEAPKRIGQECILEVEITQDDVDILTQLIQEVWICIMQLQEGVPLPEVSQYSQNYQGTQEFIADLLVGKYRKTNLPADKKKEGTPPVMDQLF